MLNHRFPLEPLKVVLLIRGMLIHYEQVVGQLGDDESKVKLVRTG
jgi:hypothetical protein